MKKGVYGLFKLLNISYKGENEQKYRENIYNFNISNNMYNHEPNFRKQSISN